MTKFYARLGLVWLVTAAAHLVVADDFRVDNAVYEGEQKVPSSESTTIFHNGVVYDCLKTPAETVVFDKPAGRFHLLNLRDRTRTELAIRDVAAFVDGLRARAAQTQDPLAKFFADPKFQERFEEATAELNLTSPLVSYRLTLERQTSLGLVDQYHEFCDWYARLRPQLVPGSRPPFARLAVNAEVAKHQATASRVVLTVTSGTGAKQQQTTIRSEHRVVSPLEPADLERVNQARAAITDFKLVSFDQYRKNEPR